MNNLKKYSVAIIALVIAFSFGVLTGCSKTEKPADVPTIPKTSAAKLPMPDNVKGIHTVQAAGNIEVAFSPGGGITTMIVQNLNKAQKSIEVQAYSFTNADIAKALVDAHKRGVQVRVILDKSQETEKYSSLTFLQNAGIPVQIDKDFQIAHSKIMIIDGIDVITGSFNFTKSAEQSNAENCLVIHGNQALAQQYIQNWQWRWEATANK
ncbi:phospholipase D family protein [Anaeroarcus burkinensis]|uniref:phospholipase D family nuclease n=1 Tax=Anaeroarcus burkinensis TaxID=82376 RepID=UPI0003FF4B51|nr:phospholipase D family protein [Anaeroarcus burkinensis]